MKDFHGLTFTRQANKWSPKDDFVLMMLVGKQSYKAISLALGRSEAAVNRRAARMGWSQREGWRTDRETRAKQIEALRKQFLESEEEDLSEYLEISDEEPLLPHIGSAGYHRERRKRLKQEG